MTNLCDLCDQLKTSAQMLKEEVDILEPKIKYGVGKSPFHEEDRDETSERYRAAVKHLRSLEDHFRFELENVERIVRRLQELNGKTLSQ